MLICYDVLNTIQETVMADTPLIMLVDDDVDFINLNKHILESKGYRVASCFSPEEAIQVDGGRNAAIGHHRSNDEGASVPVFPLPARSRDDPQFKNIPIIIVTAVSSKMGFDFRPHTADELAAMHVDAYFDKPVPPQKLLEKVAHLLEKSNP